MKATFTFFLAVFNLFLLSSCSSDDDAGTSAPTQADLIVGTWEMTSNTVDNGNATIPLQDIPIPTDFTWKGKDFDYELTFREDNELEEEGGFTVEINYSVLGQTMTYETPINVNNGNGLFLSGTYEIENNQLLITNAGETVTASIEELTETNLRLSIDLASIAPAFLGDVAENASGTNKISFTRK